MRVVHNWTNYNYALKTGPDLLMHYFYYNVLNYTTCTATSTDAKSYSNPGSMS